MTEAKQAVIGRTAERVLWLGMVVAAAGVALFSFRYIPAVGPLAPEVLANLNAAPWLALHVAGAATALMIGSVQFVAAIRNAYPQFHRWTGRIYVGGSMLGGVAGLFLALGTTAGPTASLGFGLLAIGWLVTTAQGWRHARARSFAAHRRWMIRSWALALAAVTLRLYLPIPPALGFTFEQGYVAISFLCWVPNLIAAELWIWSRAALGRRQRPAISVG